MSEQRSGYFRVEPVSPNVFSTASMAEILDQLDSCDYRCEAGPLRLNLAYMELKRRPWELQEDREQLVSVARAAKLVLDYIVEHGHIPAHEMLGALEDALKAADALY